MEITVWHHEVASNLDTIQDLARRFNNSQSEVKVKLAFQGSIGDHVIKVLASAQGGDLPTIDYMDEVYAQRLIDTGAFRPVQDFVDQEGYDLSDDFDPKVIQYYTVDGKLWAMPYRHRRSPPVSTTRSPSERWASTRRTLRRTWTK